MSTQMNQKRIFQVYPATGNAAVPNSQTWYRNFYEPCVDLGHDVFLFSTEEALKVRLNKGSKSREVFSQKVLDSFQREHKKKPFDLVFSYLIDASIETGVIDEIRKIGVPTCNFSCNNTHQFHLVNKISKHFDFNLHSEMDARKKFLKIGANPLWWPMASNPKYFKPVNVPRTISISFVGGNYALRGRYVAHLLANGIDIHAYGPLWMWGARNRWRSLAKRYLILANAIFNFSPKAQASASARLADHDFARSLTSCFPNNLHAPVSDEELVALYSRSHISLGFLEVYNGNDANCSLSRHLHLRDFEAPMCRALYFTGYMDELVEHFEPDKEVVVYHDQEELLEKVRFFLANPDQAEKVRLAGYLRALQDHTYQHRFRTLFKEIGI